MNDDELYRLFVDGFAMKFITLCCTAYKNLWMENNNTSFLTICITLPHISMDEHSTYNEQSTDSVRHDVHKNPTITDNDPSLKLLIQFLLILKCD